MNPYSIPHIIAFGITVLLSLLVLINNRKKDIIIPYLFAHTAIGLWNLGFYLILNSNTIEIAAQYNHLLITGTVFIFSTNFHFIIHFINRKTRLNKFLILTGYAFSALFLVFHFAFEIQSNVLKEFFWGYHPQAQIGDKIYTFVFSFYIIYQQVMLYKAMTEETGQRRNQFQYIFWGILLCYSGGLTNFLTAYGFPIYPVGSITNIFYTLAIAYALITVKMINIKYLFKRTLFYASIVISFIVINSLVLFLIIPAQALLAMINQSFLFTVSILSIILVTLLLIKLFGNKILNLMRPQINTRKIQNMMMEIRNTFKTNQLIEYVEQVLNGVFSTSGNKIKLFLDNKNPPANNDKKNINTVNFVDNSVKYFLTEKNEIIIKDEIQKKIEIRKPLRKKEQELFNYMKKNNISILFPIKLDNKLKGYVCIGDKLSGDMYTREEKDTIQLLKNSIQNALKNIKNIELIKEKQKQIDKETQKASRLESIGFLAGGIAHDFNNILTSIIGNVSLVIQDLNPKGELFEMLDDIEKSAKQAKNLTKQLLTFSKGGAPLTKATSIRNILVETVSFAFRGSNCKYNFNLPENLWLAEVDEGQMCQVINNIVINAEQSMPLGGTVDISAKNAKITDDSESVLKKGKYVKISIRDSGTGIPKKHLNKIFDLYFTTKQKGSGLGLATAYSIVKRHKGHIDVESEIGKGTVFHIYLPASGKKPEEPEQKEQKIITGSGRILLVDDEQEIKKSASRMFKILGYKGKVVQNSKEAVKSYKQAQKNNKEFDAVILDLTIPGEKGGEMILKQLKKIDPDVKAIVSSGYSNKPIMSEPEKYGFKGVLPKPYDVEELSKVLNDVIQ
ncbi:MAG: ATP-binding protein [Elusimicrobiota bacterium]